MATTATEIRNLHEKKQLIIGEDVTLKAVKTGRVSKILLASNAASTVKEDMSYYGTISGIEVVNLDQPNEELGAICRKPFSISVIGVRKE